MTKILASFVALLMAAALPVSARITQVAQGPLQNSGAITMQASGDARVLFEGLAERAGLNIVFAPGFQPKSSLSFKAEAIKVTEALDLLSKQTGSFWTSWDARTIVVAPDNPSSRRTFERQLVATIPAAGVPLLTELRTRHQVNGAIVDGTTIVLRDTPARIALAEGVAANSALKTNISDMGVFLTAAGTRLRSPASVRSFLKTKTPGPISLNMNGSSGTTYETLGRMAGLNVVLDSGLRPAAASIRVENVDVFDALDLLALQTSTFWQPFNETTVMVFDDTVQNRQDREVQVVETVYLPTGTTWQKANEIAFALGVLGLQGVSWNESANAIVANQTAANIVLMEAVVAVLTGSRSPLQNPIATASRNRSGERARLQIKDAGRISLNTSEAGKAVFERLAGMAGLHVLFLPGYRGRSAPFRVEDFDVVDALDLLAIQTRSVWQRLDARTILVMEDTQQNRRNYIEQIVKTVYWPAAATSSEMSGTVTTLRTTVGLSGVFQSESARAIVIKDTPQRVALAEKVIGDLRRSTAPALVVNTPDLAGVFITESGTHFRSPPSLRSRLKVQALGPVSLNANESSGAIYEGLARMAGLHVVLDRGLRPTVTSFQVDNVDFFDALDLLGLQTNTFWQPFNESTIVVFEDTQQNRRDYATHILETIYLPAGTPTQKLSEIVNILRILLGLRGVFQSEAANAILVRDTAANVFLGEKLIAELAGPVSTLRKEAASGVRAFFGESGLHFRSADYERTRLQMKDAGRISLDTNEGSKAVFEKLAGMVGLGVVFLPNYRGTSVPFKVEDFDTVDALDLLSLQSRSFWQRLDARTVLVGDDTQQNRRDYATQVLGTIHLPPTMTSQEANGIVNVLRTALNLRVVFSSETARAIVIRDTPQSVILAEKVVEQLNSSAGPVTSVLAAPEILLSEAGAHLRSPASIRSRLKVTTAGPITLNANENSGAIYKTLARMAGLHVALGSDFRSRAASLRVENVDFFDALDLLALETNTFWQPFNENTILVLEDTQQNHRDYETHVAETVHLPAGTSTQKLNEIVNVLRTVLGLRGVFQSDASNAIVVDDTAANIALVDALIAELTGPASTFRNSIASDVRDPFGETGVHLRTAQHQRDRLQAKGAGRISLSLNEPGRVIFERLAGVAGLNVVFSPTYRGTPVSFDVEDVDVIDALDLLAFRARSFWQILDARTILVGEDTQQSRRSYATQIVKTIYLPPVMTAQEMNGIVNVLRTSLNLRSIFQHDEARAIVIKDVPGRVALAEQIIAHLNTSQTPITSVFMATPGLAESGMLGSASVARTQLQLTTAGPISVNLNQDARTAFELLGQMAGLTVTFDPKFVTGTAVPVRLDAVDVLDALDHLSLQTRNSWKAVDAGTIRVAPETIRFEPVMTKVFHVANGTESQVSGIVNVLRYGMGFTQIDIGGPGVIVVWDTAQRIALAEQIVASLETRP